MSEHEKTSRPIRVVFAITELEAGGAERCCAEVAIGLDRARFEPIVYSLAPPPRDLARSLVPVLQEAGVPVRFLNATGVHNVIAVLWRFERALLLDRPDILQTFLFHANLAGRIAAKLAGTPHVFSGVRVAERRGTSRLTIDRWTDCCVDRHVCVSQSVADFSRNTGGLPSEKLIVIPNGVDYERFATAPPADLLAFGMAPGLPVITFVGRLDEQKGLVKFLTDWIVRSPQLPPHQLLFVGAGPQDSALRALADRVPVGNDVHFAGWQHDIPGILKASDILVLPSHWEGMPNVVLEAMAASLPVVCYDVEGARELLGDHSAQQIAPLGDAKALFDRLSSLLQSPDARRALGAANAARAKEKFSKYAMIEAYARLYESAARGHVAH